MIVQDMIKQVELRIQAIYSEYNNSAKMDTDTLLLYLNMSQIEIVKSYYEIYETSEKARRALANIVYNKNITRTDNSATVQTSKFPTGEYWAIPSNLMYTLKEECVVNIDEDGRITTDSTKFTRVNVKSISLDYYNVHMSNPFKSPSKSLVWRMNVSNESIYNIHELVTIEGVVVQVYNITYLCTPPEITMVVSCRLADTVHQEIVDSTVRIILQELTMSKNLIKSN